MDEHPFNSAYSPRTGSRAEGASSDRPPSDQAAAETDALTRRLQRLSESRSQRAHPLAIPKWPDSVCSAPNALLRSALFAGVQGRQRRVFKKRTLLASTSDIEIRLQGVQLDQSDLDVWLQILHLARNQLPGFPIAFQARKLLRALGRGTGNSQYAWLADSLARLGGALVEVTFKGRHTFGDHLLRYYRDEDTQMYVVEPTEEMCRLFASGYTHLEWGQRQALRRKPLALWLHGYLGSHTAPYPIKVTTLHRWSGSGAQQLRDFKSRLQTALQDLVDIGAIQQFEITAEGLVSVRQSIAHHRPSGSPGV